MTWISAIVLKMLGEYATKLALVAAAGVVYFSWQTVQRQKGAQQEQVRVEKLGEKTNAEVRKSVQRALVKPDDSLLKYVRPE